MSPGRAAAVVTFNRSPLLARSDLSSFATSISRWPTSVSPVGPVVISPRWAATMTIRERSDSCRRPVAPVHCVGVGTSAG